LTVALALLGPVSDILRIAGAYFIRRDKATRSPLNTAVAAAYTEALLHEHGALSMLLERARSRTGRIQAVHDDGILDMVVEATLERNQQIPHTLNQQQAPPL
jgi:glycerol-3-phosphate O-acyltransferase